MNPEDIPVAVIDTWPPRARCPSIRPSVRPSVRLVTVLCPSVSLQGQLANDDSNHKEEHAERQDAGAQAFVPHGRGCHGGGGVRRGH